VRPGHPFSPAPPPGRLDCGRSVDRNRIGVFEPNPNRLDKFRRHDNKKLTIAAPKMRRALLTLQRLLAQYRDNKDGKMVYHGREICVEELKYLIVDMALKGIE